MNDTDRPRFDPPPRRRRSQAERTRETRARVVAAVIESIDAVGFKRTTASEISRRAGVTWGAVQHHFEGKDGILCAVLEHSFGELQKSLRDVPGQDAPLDDRVDAFVDRSWQHYGGQTHRSTFEILLHYSRSDETEPDQHWQNHMFDAWCSVWHGVFGDTRLPDTDTLVLQSYTASVLMGLASMRLLSGQPLDFPAELSLLKTTIKQAFERGAVT